MSKELQRIQARARELARSGRFIGWRPIAFELQFEPGFTEAYEWISRHIRARRAGQHLPGSEDAALC